MSFEKDGETQTILLPFPSASSMTFYAMLSFQESSWPNRITVFMERLQGTYFLSHKSHRGVNALGLLAEQQLGLWQSSQISGNKGIRTILLLYITGRVKDVSSEQMVRSHSVKTPRIQVHFSSWSLQEFLSHLLVHRYWVWRKSLCSS